MHQLIKIEVFYISNLHFKTHKIYLYSIHKFKRVILRKIRYNAAQTVANQLNGCATKKCSMGCLR